MSPLERASVAAATGATMARPRVYRMKVCDRCETFMAPDATSCPVCSGRCGCANCGGTR